MKETWPSQSGRTSLQANSSHDQSHEIFFFINKYLTKAFVNFRSSKKLAVAAHNRNKVLDAFDP